MLMLEYYKRAPAGLRRGADRGEHQTACPSTRRSERRRLEPRAIIGAVATCCNRALCAQFLCPLLNEGTLNKEIKQTKGFLVL